MQKAWVQVPTYGEVETRSTFDARKRAYRSSFQMTADAHGEKMRDEWFPPAPQFGRSDGRHPVPSRGIPRTKMSRVGVVVRRYGSSSVNNLDARMVDIRSRRGVPAHDGASAGGGTEEQDILSVPCYRCGRSGFGPAACAADRTPTVQRPTGLSIVSLTPRSARIVTRAMIGCINAPNVERWVRSALHRTLRFRTLSVFSGSTIQCRPCLDSSAKIGASFLEAARAYRNCMRNFPPYEQLFLPKSMDVDIDGLGHFIALNGNV
ncbi:hypothetical protein C8Q80DRAFT_1150803 [Daedaleopsis nitida]|nr:hypothetical protein C8Q80DRAFT_1150803 [Daedaleopsis nitida]